MVEKCSHWVECEEDGFAIGQRLDGSTLYLCLHPDCHDIAWGSASIREMVKHLDSHENKTWEKRTAENYDISEAQRSLNRKRATFINVWNSMTDHMELKELEHGLLLQGLVEQPAFNNSGEAEAIILDMQRSGAIYERRNGVYAKI